MIAELALVYAAGNFSCPLGLKPTRHRYYKKHMSYIEPQREWVSCFSANTFRYFNSVTGKTTNIRYRPEENAFLKRDLNIAIKDLAEFSKDQNVVMAGHSWGAWFLLKASEQIKGASLITLDAISRDTCRVRGPFYGCKVFPENINESLVASNTSSWHNFYQGNDRLLQGGLAKGATNHYMFFEDHHSIKYTSDYWETLNEVIFEARNKTQDSL